MRVAAAVAAAVAVAAPAAAHPYEAYISVETPDDLQDLHAAGIIGDDTFEALLTLLLRGVDLERASRDQLYALPNLTYADVDAILAYRAAHGFIADPADLVAAGALTDGDLLAIAPFLIVRDRGRDPWAAHGVAEARTRWSVDDDAPALAARARVTTAPGLAAGIAAVVARQQLGAVVYDPNRGALLADPPALSVEIPRAYVRWQSDALTAVAGSYRIGFGQRLTFDTTGDVSPDGIEVDEQIAAPDALVRACKESSGEAASPCEGAAGHRYVTPDFRSREGLFGAAAGATAIPAGAGHVEAYAWGSWRRRSVYQYEVYDRGRCADPRDDRDPACAAPDVFRRPDGGLLDPTSRYSFATLPDLFAEAVVGGHLAYVIDPRRYLAVTGYGADSRDLVDGVDLDYQEWASRPQGGRFGAVGASAAIGRGALDVAGEVAYSFDRMAPMRGPARGGGGPAAIVRATASGDHRALEASLRYYATDFANPFAHPIAADDELEGQRARDEAGGRLRYTGRHGPLSLRAGVDAWRALAAGVPRGELFVRADVDATDRVAWGVWLAHRDKDLAHGGRGACYEVPTLDDEAGEPVPCAGARTTTIGRLRVAPVGAVSITAQLQHDLVDDPRYRDAFRHDVAGWLTAQVRPTPRLRLRGRVRYLIEDVRDDAYLEQSLWSYLDAALRVRARDQLRLRTDLYVWLDDRPSTRERAPSPELWLWLAYEARY